LAEEEVFFKQKAYKVLAPDPRFFEGLPPKIGKSVFGPFCQHPYMGMYQGRNGNFNQGKKKA